MRNGHSAVAPPSAMDASVRELVLDTVACVIAARAHLGVHDFVVRLGAADPRSNYVQGFRHPPSEDLNAVGAASDAI